MKTIYVILLLTVTFAVSAFSQKHELKISNGEIMIPFGNSVIVTSKLDGNNLTNCKLLFHSQITGVLDYNTAFDNIYFDNLSEESVAFKFGKIKCCGVETISLITMNNIAHALSFKYKTIYAEKRYNSEGESNSKGLTSFTFKGISLQPEAIVLSDFKTIE